MSILKRTRNGITFARQVPATESDRLTWEVTQDATVEGVSARIYRGAENTLHLRIKHIPASGSPTEIVQPAADDGQGGKDYIDGDDDLYEWNVALPVEDGDLLVVEHDNTDGSNAHNYRVNMNIDYMGGVQRAAAGLAELLGVR